ncbi:MAG: helix-turn-helix transcriptional regulator [Oscillibacter sp.]|nr:helix-turn-helix transcriptional regulator [Oscillibacter sp.]
MDIKKKEISERVGARIRYFRHVRAFSQEEAAFRADLNPAYYGQVERGIKCPSVDTLYKISRALEVPLPDLVRIEPPYRVPEGVANQADELLSRVPPDKMDQVLGLLEGIIELL